MELIVSHQNLDFDGLASMVAAKKIYPTAQMAIPGKMQDDVEEFYSLHKDILEIKRLGQIDLEEVNKLIVVDTNSWVRLKPLGGIIGKRPIEINLFDHHEESNDPILASTIKLERVGAATTLLVEILQEKGIPVIPFEATVMCLGIYTDTGSLTYSSTTVRDVQAVSYLLKQGANLMVVSEYLQRFLNAEQELQLNNLLSSGVTNNINGRRIFIAELFTEEYSEGLNLLLFKLMQIQDADAIFILASMGDRVFIVGRSRSYGVDVGKILQVFGGGGHYGAASATIKGGCSEELKKRLLQCLAENIKPAVTARDIMSYPVRTISPDTTVSTASSILFRYGHTGFPVMEGEKLVGVISRRDLEKAMHHGYGSSPVKGYMTRDVFTADPEMPVDKIRRLLVENNVGRLPVLENNRLVGIVTRTDVLRLLHGETIKQGYAAKYFPPHKVDNVLSYMQKNLSPQCMELLGKIGALSEGKGVKSYVVGGFVRDLLIGRKNLDIDIVIEGDSISFAYDLAKQLNADIKVFSDFGTAQIDIGENHLDIVMTRREFYAYPASLPEVELGSLYEDLVRRDFSINAMALCLNSKCFGILFDPFRGREDLEKGLIRIMHNLSFIEDPTRILRAIRFSVRFGFRLEKETERFLYEAIKQDVVKGITAERWRDELLTLLQEAAPFLWMESLGVFKAFHDGWHVTNLCQQTADQLLNCPPELQAGGEISLMRLISSMLALEEKTIREICEKLRLSRRMKGKILNFFQWKSDFYDTFNEAKFINNSSIWQMLKGLSPEGLCLIYCLSTQIGKERVLFYQQKLANISLGISGETLKKNGYQPGPCFKDVLQKLLNAKLDGIVKNTEDEMNFVLEYFARRKEKGE